MGKKPTEKADITYRARDGSVFLFEVKDRQDDAEFAMCLRNAIIHSGVSQYQLAKVARVPQGAISVFLAGGDLRLATFTRLAHVMGLELRQNRKLAPKKVKQSAAQPKKKM